MNWVFTVKNNGKYVREENELFNLISYSEETSDYSDIGEPLELQSHQDIQCVVAEDPSAIKSMVIRLVELGVVAVGDYLIGHNTPFITSIADAKSIKITIHKNSLDVIYSQIGILPDFRVTKILNGETIK